MFPPTTIRTHHTRRLATRAVAAILTVSALAAACGSDDGVESNVSSAAEAVDKAADDPSAQNVEAVDQALQKAAEAIKTRYDSIVTDFDKAADKIADENREAYDGFRNDLATIEGDLVKAVDSTGTTSSDALRSADDKATDLASDVEKHDAGADKEADKAFDKLADDLSKLADEIGKGLGTN